MKSYFFIFGFLPLMSLFSVSSKASIFNCARLLSVSNSNAASKYLHTLDSIENAAGDMEELDKLITSVLKSQINKGNSRYTLRGVFVFNSNMKEVRGAGGARHKALYRATYKGESIFIKEFDENITNPLNLVEAALHSKIMHALGIGPDSELVKIGRAYYLVMTDLPGINIKDVVSNKPKPKNTRKKIDVMLGLEKSDMKKSLRAFSEAILRSKAYMDRLQYIVSTLERYGYYSVYDFQFMIDLSIGPSSIQIIDAESFDRSRGLSDFEFYESSPSSTLKEIIETLEELSKG